MPCSIVSTVRMPNETGTPVLEGDLGQALGHLGAQKIEMGRVAADQGAQADDAVHLLRGGQFLGDDRDLERAGDFVDRDVGVVGARAFSARPGRRRGACSVRKPLNRLTTMPIFRPLA